MTTLIPSPISNLQSPSSAIQSLLSNLQTFLRLNVAEGDASEHTIRAYLTHVAQFVAWCRETNLDPNHATDQDLAVYRRALAQAGYTRSTIGVKLSALRRFYEAAIWHGLRTDNPAAGLKPPRDHTTQRDRILQRYLSPDEVHLLLNAPDWSPAGIRDRAMMNLAYYHGLRVSEVAALLTTDVIPGQHPQLQIRKAKGGKDRTLFLIERTKSLLDRWLIERTHIANHRSTDALFLSFSKNGLGSPLTPAGARYIVNHYLKQTGLYRPGLSWHALRHAHASHAIAAGADLIALSHELGHASPETTGIYTHVVDALTQNPAVFLDNDKSNHNL